MKAQRLPDVRMRGCARRVEVEFVRERVSAHSLGETFGSGNYNPLTFKVIGEATPGRFFPGSHS